jgi:hypothetical protein
MALLLAVVGALLSGASAEAPDLHRVGNKLIDRRTGEAVHLKGMAMMGGEYSCVHNVSVFAGPADLTVVEGMARWGINAIRLPMNEDCWLGLHGVDSAFSGKNYQDRFVEFTELLLSHGFVVVLGTWRRFFAFRPLVAAQLHTHSPLRAACRFALDEQHWRHGSRARLSHVAQFAQILGERCRAPSAAEQARSCL